MARKRMINPDFFADGDLVENLDFGGRLFYVGLWCIAEDSGVFEIKPFDLKMKIFPGDSVDIDLIKNYIQKLTDEDKIIQFTVGGKAYGWLTNFLKHQKLDKPTPPTLPLPEWIKWHGESEFGNQRHKYYYEVIKDNSDSCRGQVGDLSLPEEKRREEKRKEEKRREGKRKEDESTTQTVNNSSSASQVAYVLFEGEFARPLSPLEIEEVNDLENRFGYDLVKEALRRAVAQGKRNIRYTQGILERWESANLKTIQEVLDYENFAQNKRKSHASKVPNSIPTPEDHVKAMESETNRKTETINAAVTYIRFQLGPNPPPDKAKEMAIGYGEEFVPEILSQLFGKEDSK